MNVRVLSFNSADSSSLWVDSSMESSLFLYPHHSSPLFLLEIVIYSPSEITVSIFPTSIFP